MKDQQQASECDSRTVNHGNVTRYQDNTKTHAEHTMTSEKCAAYSMRNEEASVRGVKQGSDCNKHTVDRQIKPTSMLIHAAFTMTPDRNTAVIPHSMKKTEAEIRGQKPTNECDRCTVITRSSQ